MTKQTLSPHIVKPENYLKFVFAGHAKLTICGTTDRFTYKITAAKDEETKEPRTDMFLVHVMTGSDNESHKHYTYIGFFVFENDKWKFVFREKAKNLRLGIGSASPQVWAISYVVSMAQKNIVDDRIEVWHCGRCCHCGRALTVPEAIEIGIGHRCLKAMAQKDPFKTLQTEVA